MRKDGPTADEGRTVRRSPEKYEPTRAELDQIESAWKARFPAARPGNQEATRDDESGLKIDLHRWPNRRSLAEGTYDYAEGLFRSRTVLNELVSRSKSEFIFVVTRSWDDTPKRDRWLEHFLPASQWYSSDDSDHTFITKLRSADPALDAILTLAFGDVATDPMIFSADLSWLFSPCDEGVHALVDSPEWATELREEFAEWIGEHEDLRGDPQNAEESEEWGLALAHASHDQAAAILRMAGESGILADGANGFLVDPRREMTVRLRRYQAQLVRIILTQEEGPVFNGDDSEQTVSLTPEEALRRLVHDGTKLYAVTEFVGSSYREPGEALGSRLDRRFWDPEQDYSGIDGGA